MTNFPYLTTQCHDEIAPLDLTKSVDEIADEKTATPLERNQLFRNFVIGGGPFCARIGSPREQTGEVHGGGAWKTQSDKRISSYIPTPPAPPAAWDRAPGGTAQQPRAPPNTTSNKEVIKCRRNRQKKTPNLGKFRHRYPENSSSISGNFVIDIRKFYQQKTAEQHPQLGGFRRRFSGISPPPRVSQFRGAICC